MNICGKNFEARKNSGLKKPGFLKPGFLIKRFKSVHIYPWPFHIAINIPISPLDSAKSLLWML
jgi:hypothetical protein